MKVAAMQLKAAFADVKQNLSKSELLIGQASENGAELVLLPEFFTSAIGFSEKMLDVVIENSHVKSMLVKWAEKYNIIIGGSFISFDGKNAYNLFVLAFPNGETYEHSKDLPTQFENCYYTYGDTNSILSTPIGNIGVVLCWELIRYDTLKRISGKVDIVLAGSCWWDLPNNAPVEREPLRIYNQKLAEETPFTFAKLLGVPVVHANHCGKITALNFPSADKIQTRQLVGAAQIIDAERNIIGKKLFSDGEGLVFGDLLWDSSKRETRMFPDRYWIPDLPESYINAWNAINPKGKEYYDMVTLPYYKNR